MIKYLKIVFILLLSLNFLGVSFSQIPLSYIDSTQEEQSLRNILPEIVNKRIISMGEASHGSHEFFAMKVKMIQLLVTENNLRAIAIEGSFGGVTIADQFINGKGVSLNEVMDAIDLWPFQNNEFVSLLNWLKLFNENKSVENRVHIYGLDVHSGGLEYSAKAIIKELGVDTSQLTITTLNTLKSIALDSVYFYANQKRREQNHLKLESYILSLTPLKSILVSKSKMLQRHLSVINEGLKLKLSTESNQYNLRDSLMSESVSWLLEKGSVGSQIFIWAHNAHISKYKEQSSKAYAYVPMGYYLKEKYKDDYYPIGFVFRSGKTLAVKLPKTIAGIIFKYTFNRKEFYKVQSCTIKVSPANELFSNMDSMGYSTAFLSLADSSNKAIPKGIRIYNMVTSVYKRPSFSLESLDLRESFDAIIYIDKVTEASLWKSN